jgi:hypothetical protein
MKDFKPRRFGIELELSRRFLCINNSDKNYSKHWPWVDNLLYDLRNSRLISPGWKLKIDTSCGGEVVSPILIGNHGMAEVGRICYEIQKYADNLGISPVDAECGLHIHFDAADMKPRELSNLFILLQTAEPVIYSMYPTRNPKYCSPIEVNMRLASKCRDWTDVRDVWYRGENNVKDRAAVYNKSFINSTNSGDSYDGTRYHGFNIHCYWRQGTVEFRYGAGTLDPIHILAYYEMCLSMVNSAMSNKKIKINSTADMDYHSLVNHLTSNYRFRKVISKLCSDCLFSRGTIKLIMNLVKKNSPHLLGKPPSGDIIVISKENCDSYAFYIKTSREYYLHNGVMIPPKDLKYYKKIKQVINCEFAPTVVDGYSTFISVDSKYSFGDTFTARREKINPFAAILSTGTLHDFFDAAMNNDIPSILPTTTDAILFPTSTVF